MPYVRVHLYCPGLCCNPKMLFFLLHQEGNADEALFHFKQVLERLFKERRQVWHQSWRLPFTKIPGILWAHVTSAAGAEQKPWEHIFAFGSRLLSPGFTADFPAASAGREAVCEGMGKQAEQWGQPSTPSVCLGAGINFWRGPSQEAVVWINLWQSMSILIKISACRLISEAFSQVREINSR